MSKVVLYEIEDGIELDWSGEESLRDICFYKIDLPYL